MPYLRSVVEVLKLIAGSRTEEQIDCVRPGLTRLIGDNGAVIKDALGMELLRLET
jgi:hypothetical protein